MRLKIQSFIKRLKKIVQWAFGIVLGLYVGLLTALNIPMIQGKVSAQVADELGRMLDTEVSIGKIDPGLFNRLIVDDLLLLDHSGKEMLRVSRLAVHFDLLPLLSGRISISTARLYGFAFHLSKATPDAVPNYQCYFCISIK